jgi:ribonuclease P protein component
MNISTSLLSKFTKKEIDMLFKAARVMGKIPAALLLGAPATQEYGRLLLVVSKKTGNAPQRNKLRRRLKDIFYKEQLFLYKKDCIFIAKNKEVNELSFDDLKLFMKKSFERC